MTLCDDVKNIWNGSKDYINYKLGSVLHELRLLSTQSSL